MRRKRENSSLSRIQWKESMSSPPFHDPLHAYHCGVALQTPEVGFILTESRFVSLDTRLNCVNGRVQRQGEFQWPYIVLTRVSLRVPLRTVSFDTQPGGNAMRVEVFLRKNVRAHSPFIPSPSRRPVLSASASFRVHVTAFSGFRVRIHMCFHLRISVVQYLLPIDSASTLSKPVFISTKWFYWR